MGKSKSKAKKKTKMSSKIKANSRTIAIVIVLISIFSFFSFYLGMATPCSFSKPINLSALLSVSETLEITYGPIHTGARVTFQVTDQTDSWNVGIYDPNGVPVGALSGSGTGVFSTSWIPSAGGMTLWIESSTMFPSLVELEGMITITSSRFPFIY